MSRRDYWFKAFEEFNDYTTDRVKNGIENNRRGFAFIKVTDENKKPVEGAKIKAVQKNHAFFHGANLFMLDEFETEEKNRIYREEFKKYFNIATIPFYWKDLEPERGKPRYAKNSYRVYRRPAPDLCLEYCVDNGIEPKAHCLNYWNPDWVEKNPLSEQWRLYDAHVKELADRYAGQIHMWEVANETFGARTAMQKSPDYITKSFRSADRYFPQNKLIINEGCEPFASRTPERGGYYMLIDSALARGVKIDAVGLQFHIFVDDEDKERGVVYSICNPYKIYKLLDTYYDRFRLPIQISEITIPCLYPDSREAEDLQAEMIKRLYEVWFSHPAVEAAIYWNTADGYAYGAEPGDLSAGENKLAGGLMRFDLTPKPALLELYRLFNKEWHTEETIVTDEGGEAHFKGFFGDYNIIVETPDGRETRGNIRFTKSNEPKPVFGFTV